MSNENKSYEIIKRNRDLWFSDALLYQSVFEFDGSNVSTELNKKEIPPYYHQEIIFNNRLIKKFLLIL